MLGNSLHGVYPYLRFHRKTQVEWSVGISKHQRLTRPGNRRAGLCRSAALTARALAEGSLRVR